VDERRGRVFVANTSSNSVSVLDARSGALLRTVVVGTGPSAVAVDERIGKVFVSTLGDDRTRVLDAQSGSVVRTIRVGESPDAVAVDPDTDRVVVATRDDASASVLDARRGDVLDTVTVGVQPLAVAVDGQTSRAFVVSYGGTVDHPAGWLVSLAQVVWRWLPLQVLPMLPEWAQQATAHAVPAGVSVLDTAADDRDHDAPDRDSVRPHQGWRHEPYGVDKGLGTVAVTRYSDSGSSPLHRKEVTCHRVSKRPACLGA
jgi:YVTN family beta-propeller protein